MTYNNFVAYLQKSNYIYIIINNKIMNLYAIQFTHYGPKSSEHGIREFLLAENEEKVYEYIKNEHAWDWEDKENAVYDEKEEAWKDEYGEYHYWYTENGVEGWKERKLRLRGDLDDDSSGENADFFYGFTEWGWELLKEGLDPLALEFLSDLPITKK